MEVITSINSAINSVVWGVPMLVLLVGGGLLLTIRTFGVQFRKFGYAMKNTLGKVFTKTEAKEGEITPFQAMSTALAGTVGTGNIAGITTAITLGGPGTLFWLWITALIGMATKYSEVLLSVKFRERNQYGDWVGGPMYYIKNGLGKNWKWLGGMFCVFTALAALGTGNAIQSGNIVSSINTVVKAFSPSFSGQNVLNLVLGIVLAALAAVVLLGGVKRLGAVTEKLVPAMAMVYILACLAVIIYNAQHLPAIFRDIFVGAFTPSGITGGAVGSMILVITWGMKRGIFSNEAGLGTGSIAHACADTKKPVKQGMFGIFEVFADTIVICTLTAMVILCSGTTVNYGIAAGAELTISGFTTTYGGWASIFTAVALCCFAFSTIIGWGLYGSRFIAFLCRSDKVVRPFFVVYSFVSILGATMDLGLMWSIADTFNGLMSIPNLIALLLLSGTVAQLTKEYFEKEKV